MGSQGTDSLTKSIPCTIRLFAQVGPCPLLCTNLLIPARLGSLARLRAQLHPRPSEPGERGRLLRGDVNRDHRAVHLVRRADRAARRVCAAVRPRAVPPRRPVAACRECRGRVDRVHYGRVRAPRGEPGRRPDAELCSSRSGDRARVCTWFLGA